MRSLPIFSRTLARMSSTHALHDAEVILRSPRSVRTCTGLSSFLNVWQGNDDCVLYLDYTDLVKTLVDLGLYEGNH